MCWYRQTRGCLYRLHAAPALQSRCCPAAGCLQLCGRSGLHLKLPGGVRLHLAELEAALGSHAAVREAAAQLASAPAQHEPWAQLPDEGGGEAGVELGGGAVTVWCNNATNATHATHATYAVTVWCYVVLEEGAREGGGTGSGGVAAWAGGVEEEEEEEEEEDGGVPVLLRGALAAELEAAARARLPARGAGLRLRLAALRALPRGPAGKLLRPQLPPLPPEPAPPHDPSGAPSLSRCASARSRAASEACMAQLNTS